MSARAAGHKARRSLTDSLHQHSRHYKRLRLLRAYAPPDDQSPPALLGLLGEADRYVNAGLICPEPRQAARHPMSARPEPPGPAGRSLPLPNAPGSASCLHETMRASCSFSYPRIPRCRGPHIGVPAWRQDSTLTPCVTGMPAAHRPFASAAGVSRNQGALPGAFQISQAPAGPPSIPCL